jgi:hypothetical protein
MNRSLQGSRRLESTLIVLAVATASSLVLVNAIVTRIARCDPDGASPAPLAWAFWILGPISLGGASAAAFLLGIRRSWGPVACGAGALAFAVAWTLAVSFVAVFTTSPDCFH